MSYAKSSLAARSSLFGDRGDRDIERAIPSGGSGSNGIFDSGQQERENDHSIDHLSDRVAGLKKITTDIQMEADSQLKLLDKMGDSMDGAKGLLGGTVAKFTKAINHKGSKTIFYMVGGAVVIALLFYFFYRH